MQSQSINNCVGCMDGTHIGMDSSAHWTAHWQAIRGTDSELHQHYYFPKIDQRFYYGVLHVGLHVSTTMLLTIVTLRNGNVSFCTITRKPQKCIRAKTTSVTGIIYNIIQINLIMFLINNFINISSCIYEMLQSN